MSEIKRVAVIGCSGSIGRQTINVIENHRELFKLAAVTVNQNTKHLENVCVSHSPSFIGIADESLRGEFSAPHYCEILHGSDCNQIAAAREDVDLVVIALPGVEAIHPLLTAIKANKHIAIANKEAIVCGGELINQALKSSQAIMVPVDSEQSAIFQCLQSVQQKDVSKLILTASGGPFRNTPTEELGNVSLDRALQHPNWRGMGAKITIDCATLANKGLEVMEAHSLFNVDDISVLIHPQSVVHSMIETIDGGVLAQLSVPDMRLSIQYALTYPKRIVSDVSKLDFEQYSQLQFYKPDMEKFPALKLAYQALAAGRNAPTIFEAANEAAVACFSRGQIRFTSIPLMIEHALNVIEASDVASVAAILAHASKARQCVYAFAEHNEGKL